MKINWKVRVKNIVWWVQILLAFLASVCTYAGLTMADLTTWKALGEVILGALNNPFVLFMTAVSIWNAINDPTTAGIGDSEQVLGYCKPKEE